MAIYSRLEAMSYVATATSVARGVRLENFTSTPKAAIVWNGMEDQRPKLTEMIDDMCKRVFCYLVTIDHEFQKPFSMMMSSTVLGVNIQYSSILRPNLFPNTMV